MSKVLIKRVYPQYFEELRTGAKTYEIRLGTFQAAVGDILYLKEYDPAVGKYTGRELKREISNMIKTNDLKFWTKEVKHAHGFVIMGLKEPDSDGLSKG